MPSRDQLRIGIALSLMTGLGLALQTAARADSGGSDPIDTALRDGAPRIMKYVKDHGYKTVGVLKFTVKKGDATLKLKKEEINVPLCYTLKNIRLFFHVSSPRVSDAGN